MDKDLTITVEGLVVTITTKEQCWTIIYPDQKTLQSALIDVDKTLKNPFGAKEIYGCTTK